MRDDMTCDQLEDLLPELLDGELEQGLLDRALNHVALCEACTFTKNQYDRMQQLYRDHGTLKLPEEARQRIRATLSG